jgi:TolA-binding protein
MKSSLALYSLVTISLFTTSASAQDIAPQDESALTKDMDKQLSEMQSEMNSMLLQIARLRQQSQLQKNVNKMQRQIEDLGSTTDPGTRQTLLQSHMKTLQEHLKVVQNMSESEGGSSGKKNARHVSPSSPGRIFYGPGPMGYPGGMIYDPGMTGSPQIYPGAFPIPNYR